SKTERKEKVLNLQKRAVRLKNKAFGALLNSDTALSEWYELRLDIVQIAIQRLCHI
ncbi:unnamed protein product, partial [marine sediment metagenome]